MLHVTVHKLICFSKRGLMLLQKVLTLVNLHSLRRLILGDTFRFIEFQHVKGPINNRILTPVVCESECCGSLIVR